MQKPLLVAACATLGTSLSAQTTLYVSPTGTGTGESWTQAAPLHGALTAARSGDVLWLRHGTYLTSDASDREAAFKVASGVTLLGGFAGEEDNAAQRNPKQNVTILSGEIGTIERHDNAFTVVLVEAASATTTIDGLTIRGGFASGAGPTADAKRAGGGALIRGNETGKTSAPTFVNVNFADNYARDGGAVYVDARGGKATPSFVRCDFSANEADLDGGAIYNDGRHHGDASPSLVSCTFEGNVANYGGAIFNQATKGASSPRLSKCDFKRNHAYVRGASLYNLDHQGANAPMLANCTFDDLDRGADADTQLARGN